MYKISEASNYKNLNSKTDLIFLIREHAKRLNRDMQGYTNILLKAKSKKELFCMFAGLELKKNKGEINK